jgi:hypothetical protein
MQAIAMESAKAGDWQLADAMELIERHRTNDGIVGGILVNGRMRAIYVDKSEDADDAKYCDSCGQEIERGDDVDIFRPPYAVDLNGQPSSLEFVDRENQFMRMRNARQIVRAAVRELSKGINHAH